MSFTKFFFKQIDLFGYLPQNTYRNKDAIKPIENRGYCDSNNEECTLDLYCLKNQLTEKKPVFINLHGGGFVAGDKKYRRSFSEYVAKFGVKVLNINYGLAPNRNLKEILKETICIFDWIKENSENYGLDSDKIILCGDSAGAYLSALSKNSEYAKMIDINELNANIIGVVLFSGIYFPTHSLGKFMVLDLNHSLWGYLCGEKFVDVESCKKNEMYNFIDVGNFITSDFPPVFISHTDNDVFCKGNGEKLVSKLNELSIPFREVHSTSDLHDWQENMFTRSAKLTLKHFDKYMQDLLSGTISTENNKTITISFGRLKRTD